MTLSPRTTAIGVVIVTFNGADVVVGCLDSLLAQTGAIPQILVVDNASGDDTVATLRDWAARHGHALPEAHSVEGAAEALARDRIALLHSGANRGFAGGVNLGLATLARLPAVGHFWVLNPDAEATPDATAAILAEAARTPGYGMMGGRVCYAETPPRTQIDGGTVNHWTGVTGNLNLGANPATVPQPDAAQVAFITGANLVVSRRFYEDVGPMREDYFLYYEEVDWAMRRGRWPIVVAPGFVVRHHAGTAIGSPTLDRIASPFSFWFKYRSRMMFVSRFYPLSLPVALANATAKAAQIWLKGARPQATTLLRAAWGLPAPAAVRDVLSPDAQRIAFGR